MLVKGAIVSLYLRPKYTLYCYEFLVDLGDPFTYILQNYFADTGADCPGVSKVILKDMMTSSNGNIFRVTDHLCGEFTDDRTPHKGQWRGALMFSVICAWINGWVKNGEAGDLRRHRTQYDVTKEMAKIHR